MSPLLMSAIALRNFEMSPGVIARWSYGGVRTSSEQCDEPARGVKEIVDTLDSAVSAD